MARLISALALVATLGFPPLFAQTYTVTSNADTAAAGTLRWAITQANSTPGSTISVNNNLGTITLGSALPFVTAAVTINGGSGNTVSGAGQSRIFFIDAPSAAVAISGFTLANGYAKGGDGGDGMKGGGGGLGAGGALFVNRGNVTLSGVSLANNTVVGGKGGNGTTGGGGFSGGGGGFGGNGGAGGVATGGGGGGFGGNGGGGTSSVLLGSSGASGGGGGGGGLSGNGGNGGFNTGGGGGAIGQGAPGSSLDRPGELGGNGGTGGGGAGGIYTINGYSGGGGGSTNGGGGGGGRGNYAPGGGGGTFGGGGGGASASPGGTGGDFGGGGGAGSTSFPSAIAGGGGGFGGGGGAGQANGNGGFGGGSGGGGQSAGTSAFGGGTAGYNGTGDYSAGGGGAGLGAAIFVRGENGASLTVVDTTFAGGSVTGGSGGTVQEFTLRASTAGTGLGTALFLSGGTVAFDVTGTRELTDTLASSSVNAGIDKRGSGTLVLLGDNSLLGTTTISAGTLQIGNGGGTGTLTGNVMNQGALVFNRTGTSTFAGLISGSGTLEKNGAGRLTLSGANDYTGATTLNAGTLELGHNHALGTGTLIVNGGSLQPSLAGRTLANALDLRGSFSLGRDLTFTGNSTVAAPITITTDNPDGTVRDSTFSGVMSGDQRLTVARTGTGGYLVLSGNNTHTGGITVSGRLGIAQDASLGAAGNIVTLDGGTLRAFGTITGSHALAVASGGGTLDTNGYDATFGSLSGAGTFTKTGGGAMILAGSSVFENTLNVTGSLSTLQIASTGSLQIGNGGTSGVLGGGVTNNGSLIFNRSDNVTYGDRISGSGTVTKLGDGTLTLSGSQAITGPFTVGAGTLKLSSGVIFEIFNGGSLSGNLTNDGTLSFARTDSFTYGGVISGSGAIQKQGGGTLALTGAIPAGNSLEIVGGAVSIGDGGTAGSFGGSIYLNSGTNVVFNRSDDSIYSGWLSGSQGGVIKLGSGKLTLTGTTGLIGGITLSAGTLSVGSSDLLGSIFSTNTLTFAGGTLQVTGTSFTSFGARNVNYATFNGGLDIANTFTVSQALGGSGVLMKSGAGTLILSGANTYTGPTTVAAGTLKFTNPTALYNNGAAAAWSTSTLIVESGATALFAVGGTNEFTAVNIATLAALRTATGGFKPGSFIGLDTTNAPGGDFLYSAALAGSTLGLVKQGTGTLTLGGANTFAGGTVLGGGKLMLTGTLVARAGTAGTTSAAGEAGGASVATSAGTLLEVGASSNASTGRITGGNGGAGATGGTGIVGTAGGTGGAAGSIGAGASLVNAGILRGGNGGNGGNGTRNGTGSALSGAGGSGAPGFSLATGASVTNTGTIAGGQGGTSGFAQNSSNSASATSRSGDAGSGGRALDFAVAGTVVNSGSLTGGTGGLAGTAASTGPATGGLGGAGGHAIAFGGAGVVTNSGTIAGGNGAAGGDASSSVGANVLSGNGGAGGTGIAFGPNSTLTNEAAGQITGGTGGNRFDSAIAGAGGAAVTGAGLTFVNSGTLTGGLGGSGGARADAITFGGTGNSLELRAGSTITGNVVGSATGTDALLLGGDTDATLSAVIGNSGQYRNFDSLTKIGAGTWTLTAANTYAAVTTVTQGTLSIAHAAALGDTAAGTTVSSGGTLNLNGVTLTGEALTLSGSGDAGTGALTGTGNASVSSTITLAANSALGAATSADTLTVTGAIGESGGARTLTKVGDGTVVLTGTTNYTGTTIVSAGTLTLGTGSIFTSSTPITVSAGATLALNNFSRTFTALGGAGTVDLGSGRLTLGTGATDTTLALAFTGSGGLTKSGIRGVTLTAPSTYSGDTIISQGDLAFSGNGTLYNQGTSSGSIVVQQGGVLDLNRHDFFGNHMANPVATLTINGGLVQNFGRTFNTFTNLTINGGELLTTGGGSSVFPAWQLKGTVTVGGSTASRFTVYGASPNPDIQIGNNTAGGFTTFAVSDATGSAATDLSIANPVVDGRDAGGAPVSSGLVKTGAGTLTLYGAGDYTGGTTISAGTFALGDHERLANSGAVTLNGGTLALGAFNETVGVVTLASGNITGTGTLTGSSYAVQSGTIAAPLGGNAALTKTTSGTVALNAASTFSGGTTISFGTIQTGHTSAFGTGPVAVSAAGAILALNGTALANAVNLTNGGALSGSGGVGALSVSSGGSVSPGNSPGTLTAGPTTFGSGGIYMWEINNAASPATSAGTRYDLLSITGTLSITATSGSPFTINLTSLLADNTAGAVINFNSSVNSSYTVATASSGISGFSADKFSLNTTGFTNALNGGSWSIGTLGNDLNLTFTASAIPEPSTYAALLGISALALAVSCRRRHRSK